MALITYQNIFHCFDGQCDNRLTIFYEFSDISFKKNVSDRKGFFPNMTHILEKIKSLRFRKSISSRNCLTITVFINILMQY